MQPQTAHAVDASRLALDLDLVRRALAREAGAFRTIMQTYNRRLFRLARSILRSDSEAEDAVQEAYVRAFSHLDGFRGESTLSTWLSRIVINESLRLLRRRRPTTEFSTWEKHVTEATIIPFPHPAAADDPERTMARQQILQLVEKATDALPEVFRRVFVMRAIEGLSVETTAELLGVPAATVKTRLHRARRLLRAQLDKQVGTLLPDTFPFAGVRCERLTNCVLRRLDLIA
jgi:RNA polymerase sigma-70 factor (ECF subfamily)